MGERWDFNLLVGPVNYKKNVCKMRKAMIELSLHVTTLVLTSQKSHKITGKWEMEYLSGRTSIFRHWHFWLLVILPEATRFCSKCITPFKRIEKEAQIWIVPKEATYSGSGFGNFLRDGKMPWEVIRNIVINLFVHVFEIYTFLKYKTGRKKLALQNLTKAWKTQTQNCYPFLNKKFEINGLTKGWLSMRI